MTTFELNANPLIHKYEKQFETVRRAEREGSSVRHQPGRDDKLYSVCVEFESLFIKQMLNSMRKTVEKGEMLHGGYAEEIFEDMLYDEYSVLMAKSSGFGVAEMAYRQLSPQDSGIIKPSLQ
jgi:Rod binding domain-containing protein